MEKVDEDSAAKFINALIKSVQTLCHGYLEFNNGIEIIGHINLSVDKGSSLHYILEEKVCKNEENSTLFISNSFHAQNQKSDAKSKGKDLDTQVGSRGEEKTSASDLGEAGKLSAISSISSALSKSHEKNRSGSTSSVKDLENVHSKPLSSTAKRKASDDHSNDIRAAKSSHLSSSPSAVSHFLSHSPHDPSGSSSPVDTKPSFRLLHSEDSATVLPQTAAVTSDGAGDLGVNLASSVLERVDDQSNSDLPDRGEDSDGDLEVTFIKEEYVEGEQSTCQFENSGGQQYGRGTHQRASSSDMSDGSMYPVSLHHSQSASSGFVAGAHDMAAQHYGPSTSSGHPQPGTSGVRGSQGHIRPFSSPHQLSPRVESQTQADSWVGMQKVWAMPESLLPRCGSQEKVQTVDAMQSQQRSREQSVGIPQCGRVSDSAFSMAGTDMDRSGDGSYLYKCEFCGTQFKTAHGFKGHVRKNHSNDPNFRCELCGKGFLMKGHYEGHMNMHNNVKTFHCSKCPRSFAYKSSLNAHVKFCVGGTSGSVTDSYWESGGSV